MSVCLSSFRNGEEVLNQFSIFFTILTNETYTRNVDVIRFLFNSFVQFSFDMAFGNKKKREKKKKKNFSTKNNQNYVAAMMWIFLATIFFLLYLYVNYESLDCWLFDFVPSTTCLAGRQTISRKKNCAINFHLDFFSSCLSTVCMCVCK